MNSAGLQVTTPTDTSIVFTRAFQAPRHLVWDAMTNPDLLPRWMFCPPGWSWAGCEMDVRVGGKYRWAWSGPNGQPAMVISGEHREVDPPSRIVHTEHMWMAPMDGQCGSQDSPEPWELLASIELAESGGRTTMTMTLSFGSKNARDAALASGMEQGMEAGYLSLDALFAKT